MSEGTPFIDGCVSILISPLARCADFAYADAAMSPRRRVSYLRSADTGWYFRRPREAVGTAAVADVDNIGFTRRRRFRHRRRRDARDA